MPEVESVRTTAEAVGRITCIKTGEEIGLQYRWNNGDMQAALYEDNLSETPICPEQQTKPDLSINRS